MVAFDIEATRPSLRSWAAFGPQEKSESTYGRKMQKEETPCAAHVFGQLRWYPKWPESGF